jgi:hypothetical protein
MDPTVLLEETMPNVVAGMKSEGIKAVLLTITPEFNRECDRCCASIFHQAPIIVI